MSYTREVPLESGKAALLIIDVQNYFCKPGQGLLKSEEVQENKKFFLDKLQNRVIQSLQNLLKACRSNREKIDVIYTYVESLTQEGRDQSLDYKITGFNVPKGHSDARIIDEIGPEGDEIMIPKTACSVFNSTNIQYVLRNLGVTQLVVSGVATNQCVESAVRDAADLGFYVTLVEDACTTFSQAEHDSGLHNMKGFSRIVPHTTVIKDIQGWNN